MEEQFVSDTVEELKVSRETSVRGWGIGRVVFVMEIYLWLDGL